MGKIQLGAQEGIRNYAVEISPSSLFNVRKKLNAADNLIVSESIRLICPIAVGRFARENYEKSRLLICRLIACFRFGGSLGRVAHPFAKLRKDAAPEVQIQLKVVPPAIFYDQLFHRLITAFMNPAPFAVGQHTGEPSNSK